MHLNTHTPLFIFSLFLSLGCLRIISDFMLALYDQATLIQKKLLKIPKQHSRIYKKLEINYSVVFF